MTFKKAPPQDLGLGSRLGSSRNMNKDGAYNIERLGDPVFRPYEIFHQLISMSWAKFLSVIFLAFVSANFIFAGIYVALGTEHIAGIPPGLSFWENFFEAFFFSTQTLTTLGYGRVAPVGFFTDTVAAGESLLGLMCFALATGLLYGRFSRPVAKLLYSTHAVVAPYQKGQGLMFRLANKRRNQLIEVEVELTLAYRHPKTGRRAFATLDLERNKVSLFPLSWTVVHPLDRKSPLFHKGPADLKAMNIELIVLLKAFDDTFSQTIYSRTSYTADEILFGHRFKPMFHLGEDGRAQLDIRLMDGVEPVGPSPR